MWSTSATAFKLTLGGMNNIQLLFYSSLISTIILGFFYYRKTHTTLKFFFKKENVLSGIKLGFANPFLYYIILFKAYSLLKAQEALALNFTWPIAISVFSWIFLNQKKNKTIIAGLLVAFIGVIIISTRGDIFNFSFDSPLGISLALVSSIVWASYWIMNLLDKRGDYEKLFNAFFYGTILVTIYVLLFDSFSVVKPISILGAVYIGLFEMGFGFIFWLKGLELSTNKARTSTLAYLSPFLSLAVIALVLGEPLLFSSIIGLGFIIGGISLQHINFGKILGNFSKK